MASNEFDNPAIAAKDAPVNAELSEDAYWSLMLHKDNEDSDVWVRLRRMVDAGEVLD